MEPPGDIHTLEVPDGVEEMVTMFHVTGGEKQKSDEAI